MIQTFNLEDLHRIEKRLSEPLDLERERWEAQRYRYLPDNDQVLKVPTIGGGSGFSANDTYVSTLFASAATGLGAALASFTAEAIMYGSTIPQAYVPSDFVDPTYSLNRTIRFTARGIYSTTSAPTFTAGLRIDTVSGTILGTSLAITAQTTVTNLVWEIECDLTVQSFSFASSHNEGLVATYGMVSGVSTGSNGFTNGSAIGTQTTTTAATITQIDARHYLVPTITCGSLSSSNKWQLLQLIVQSLN